MEDFSRNPDGDEPRPNKKFHFELQMCRNCSFGMSMPHMRGKKIFKNKGGSLKG
jgi:hypothetical protein